MGLLVLVVQEALEKDSNNFITKWRFFPLFEAIQARVMALLTEYLLPAEPQRRLEIEAIVSSSFLYKYENLLAHYEYMSPENAELFCQYLVSVDQARVQNFNLFKIIINAFTKLPYVEINPHKETIR